jgi:hypothetical protein
MKQHVGSNVEFVRSADGGYSIHHPLVGVNLIRL